MRDTKISRFIVKLKLTPRSDPRNCRETRGQAPLVQTRHSSFKKKKKDTAVIHSEVLFQIN